MIKAVLFDLIGTTVSETDPEIINNCFEKAFSDNNIPVDTSLIKKDRGKDKRLIITNVLKFQQLSLSHVQDIYTSFKKNVLANINKFSENDGAKEIFLYLQDRNIKLGIGTGLERDIFTEIFYRLNWNNIHFDYIGIGNETGRGRPYPDMIFDMMNKLSVLDKGEFLKVGDTVADIEEGKNAKVLTAVILSGTQSKDDLLNAAPDYVLNSLIDIKKIV